MDRSKEIEQTINNVVDDTDVRLDSTLQSLPQISKVIAMVEPDAINTIVGLGSGRGALISALGEVMDATEAHAVDIDDDSLSTANKRGLSTHKLNVEIEPLPMRDDSVDLVVSFGLLEHFTWFDNAIEETARVLREDGFAIFAMPNMSGWTNRLSLLLGHQPRNIEFSQKQAFGILDAYDTDSPIGHVHTTTIGAFQEFLEYNNLDPVKTVGLHPYQRSKPIALIDKAVSWRPSLCRRFAVLARMHSTE